MSWITEHLQHFNTQIIPRKLHIITGDTPPDYAIEYIAQWKALMPDWEIRHWKDEHVTEEEFPADIVEKIKSCEKGAQRADIMRYFIVEKHGGFYVDSDVKPHRSLEPLRFMSADIILCHDNIVEWEYVINAFFGGVAHHPLLQHACEMARNAQLNTGDIHFKTGPHLWGIAVSQVPPPDGKKYMLLPTEYFYVNEWNNNRFAQHLYAASWR